MSKRNELIMKFIFLLSGLALFVMLVYGGTQREETDPVDPKPTPTQTPSQELTPKE